MQIMKKIKQTVRIALLCCAFFKKYPVLLIFPLLSFIAYALLELLILFLIYLRYGIHFFNPNTIELWGLISAWELGIVFILFIAPIYCIVTFFILLSKASLSHAIIVLIEDRPFFSFTESLIQGLSCSYELLKYAYLKTILIIVGESSIKRFLRRHVQILGGRDFIYQSKAENWLEATFLVVPILVFHRIFLQKAVQKSIILMQEMFGKKLSANFSFVGLIIIFATIIAFPCANSLAAKTNSLAAISLFFLLLGIIMCSIRGLEGIFHAIVYQYCLHRSTGEFSKADIKQSFIQEKEELI